MVQAFDSDRPITTPGEDLLGRAEFSKRVATILSRHTGEEPLVVGLYGPWGSGKTSIVNLINAELKSKDVLIVEFNPWYFSGETQLLEHFFEEIAAALGGGSGPARAQVAVALRKYLNALKPAAKLLSAASDVVLPGSGMLARGIAEVAIPAVDGAVGIVEPAVDLLGKNASIADARNAVRKKLRESKLRIVVMMDDIDRLEPADIRTVLKLVRLVGDLPYVSYLLSFDPVVVARSLSRGWGDDLEPTKGREYLEKIVQIEIQLPRVRKDELRKIALDGIAKTLDQHSIRLTDESARRLVDGWGSGIQSRIETIRQIKRALSSIGFAVGLLKDEVDVVDLVLMEALRTVHPEVFDAIRMEPERVLKTGRYRALLRESTKNETKGVLDERLGRLGAVERDGVVRLLASLFPRFGVSGGFFSKDAVEWRKEKRVASGEHLEKALSYGVPAGIVSDAQYVQALQALSEGDEALFRELLEALTGRSGWTDLVWRFREDRSTWSPDVACKIALVVSGASASLERTESIIGTSSFRNGALFAGEVIWSIRKQPEVASFATSLIRKAETLYFSGLVVQSLRRIKNADGENSDLGNWDEAFSQAQSAFIDRVNKELDLTRAVDSFESVELGFVMSCWKAWAGQGSVESSIREAIKKEPTFARRFVSAFMPGLRKGEFESPIVWKDAVMDGYRALAELVSPVLLVRALGHGPDVTKRETIDAERFAALSRLEQSEILFMDAYHSQMKGKGGEAAE